MTFLFLTPLKILPSSYVSIDVVVGDGDNCIGIGSFLVQSEDLCMYFDGSDLGLESNVWHTSLKAQSQLTNAHPFDIKK